MKNFSMLLLALFLLISVFIHGSGKTVLQKRAQLIENRAIPVDDGKKGQNVRVVFYNVENLYDPYDDSTKLDDEFTSAGAKRWTFDRFFTKLQHLAKTLTAAGEWEFPAIVGMCEIENRYVLNKLIHETPLKKAGYRIIHHESPDLRGVDVAMLYRPDRFELILSQVIRVHFPFDTNTVTRDILMVKGILAKSDTVFFFVNHWPSRRGGAQGSSGKRNYVAGLLRAKTDSLLQRNPGCKIIIMGDFNDEPDNESICQVLGARCTTSGLLPDDLVNLMCAGKKNFPGTIKYQGKWSIFDQFIVSGGLLIKNNGLYTSPEDAKIFCADFLLQTDDRFLGSKLNRTYSGPAYQGGFSDHLPVILDLKYLPHRHIEISGD